MLSTSAEKALIHIRGNPTYLTNGQDFQAMITDVKLGEGCEPMVYSLKGQKSIGDIHLGGNGCNFKVWISLELSKFMKIYLFYVFLKLMIVFKPETRIEYIRIPISITRKAFAKVSRSLLPEPGNCFTTCYSNPQNLYTRFFPDPTLLRQLLQPKCIYECSILQKNWHASVPGPFY